MRTEIHEIEISIVHFFSILVSIWLLWNNRENKETKACSLKNINKIDDSDKEGITISGMK